MEVKIPLRKTTAPGRQEDRVTCPRDGCHKLLAVRQADGTLELKWQTLHVKMSLPASITCPRCGSVADVPK